MSYRLEPGEGILHRASGVTVTGDLDIEYAEAMLTSKYFVFLEEEDEDEYNITKIPLSDIRVFQNTPQVFIAGDDPAMEVYFNDRSIAITFDIFRASKCKEAYQKWIDAINSMFSRGEIPTVERSVSSALSQGSLYRDLSESLSQKKNFCMNCGQKIIKDGNFCIRCGARV